MLRWLAAKDVSDATPLGRSIHRVRIAARELEASSLEMKEQVGGGRIEQQIDSKCSKDVVK